MTALVLSDDDVVDEGVAAPIIGWSVKTLQKKRVYGGGPPYLKIGRSVRYKVGVCRAWRDARMVSSTSEQVPA